MSTDPTAGDALANLRESFDAVAKASRVIIVHPDREEGVRAAVAASPFPGLIEVTVSRECPADKVYLIPKPLLGYDGGSA